MKQILVVCAVLFLMSSSAHAALMSDSDFSTGTLPQTAAQVDTLVVDQFDPLLGTLNKVTVDLDNIFDWTNRGENMSTSSGGSLTHSLDMDLEVSLGSFLLADDLSFNNTWDLLAYDGTLDFDGLSGFTAPGQSVLKTGTIELTGVDMLLFIGTGAVDFTIFGSSQSSMSNTTGNAAQGISSSYTANAMVTYDYDAVPIPSAIWLLGSGLIGIMGFRKFRKV